MSAPRDVEAALAAILGKKRKSHHLRDIRLDEVSLVTRGANPHAAVLLYKSLNGQPGSGGDDEGSNDMPAPNGNKVQKSEAELLDDANASIAALTILAKMSDAEKAHLNGLDTSEAKAAFMKMSGTDRATVVAEAVKKAGGESGGSATERVNKMAAERAKSEKVPFAKAYASILAEEPDLYAAIEKEGAAPIMKAAPAPRTGTGSTQERVNKMAVARSKASNGAVSFSKAMSDILAEQPALYTAIEAEQAA